MRTRVTHDVAEAAAHLDDGVIVAFPTETVWGLGARAEDPAAIAAIYAAKRRPSDNPLIVHVASVEAACALMGPGDDAARARLLLDRFAPGPITVVVTRPPSLPAEVSAGLDTVAIRVPAHPVATALLRAVGVPIAAPSANRSGRPSPTTLDGVLASLDGDIPLILDGPASTVGLESTVIDCTSQPVAVLRAGAVSVESIRTVIPGATAATTTEARRKSPGTRHRHYAPACRVLLHAPGTPWPIEDGTRSVAFIGQAIPDTETHTLTLCARCETLEDYARNLFEFMRRCDQAKIDVLVCEAVPRRGLGAALMDRLERAARG